VAGRGFAAPLGEAARMRDLARAGAEQIIFEAHDRLAAFEPILRFDIPPEQAAHGVGALLAPDRLEQVQPRGGKIAAQRAKLPHQRR